MQVEAGSESKADALVRLVGELLSDPDADKGTPLQSQKARQVKLSALNQQLIERAGVKMIFHLPPKLQDEIDYKLYLYPEAERPKEPHYVNIGAGKWSHPYWHNLDNPSEHYAPMQTSEFIAHDLMTKTPLPIESESVAAVYTSHVVEHLPDDVDQHMFSEVFRVLEPGGYFRITCPDQGMLYDAFVRGDTLWMAEIQPVQRVPSEQHLVGYMATEVRFRLSPDEIRTVMANMTPEDAMDYFVAQCDPAMNAKRPGWHRNWMSPAKLDRMLRAAGFTDVYETRAQQSRCPLMRHPRLFDVVGPGESLYVEARKT